MRRSTAVGQVERIVAAADEIRGLVEIGFDIPLVEVWVGGAILEPGDRIDVYDVALGVDAPAEDVPWRAADPTGAWIADRMRLTKMPVTWFVRPAGRPVLDGRLRTMVRVWSTAGPEHDTSTGSAAATPRSRTRRRPTPSSCPPSWRKATAASRTYSTTTTIVTGAGSTPATVRTPRTICGAPHRPYAS